MAAPHPTASETTLSHRALTLSPALPLALTITVATVIASPAQAASKPPMKAGLWEVKSLSRELNGKPLPDVSAMMAERMAQMPPEMRAKMAAQMKQHGVAMGGGGVKVCISQEMIDTQRWHQPEGKCQNSAVTQSGNTWTLSFSCQNPEAKGEVRTTFQGGDTYTSEVDMTMNRGGKDSTMRMRNEAHWLGADCGSVQPENPRAPSPTPKP